ncbi:MAG: hypothetical protein NZZ41_04120 [Candidatus Dojkabacteria bacterium]|nr:hypothetical protein [Candidatus Dojkabacteria bacterium]
MPYLSNLLNNYSSNYLNIDFTTNVERTRNLFYTRFLAALEALSYRNKNDNTVVVITPSFSFPTLTSISAGSISGALRLLDGRILHVPRDETRLFIYDPSTNVLVTAATVAATANKFVGATLMHDGRVFIAAHNVNYSLIYNPLNNTIITPAGTYPTGTLSNCFGCTTLRNGNIFICPGTGILTSPPARIYNPITNTLSTPALGYPLGQLRGHCVLSDGRIFFTPRTANAISIYNPFNDTVFTQALTTSFMDGHQGAVQLKDGRIFMCPHDAPYGLIYDPANQIFATPSFTLASGGNKFLMPVLLPNGHVLMTPLGAVPNATIYDPFTDTIYTPNGGFGTSYNAIYLSPNEVYVCNTNTNQVPRIVKVTMETLTSKELILSPFFNKSI